MVPSFQGTLAGVFMLGRENTSVTPCHGSTHRRVVPIHHLARRAGLGAQLPPVCETHATPRASAVEDPACVQSSVVLAVRTILASLPPTAFSRILRQPLAVQSPDEMVPYHHRISLPLLHKLLALPPSRKYSIR